MGTCDLHLHSTASDGSDPPEQLPRLAVAAGLKVIALTDHDTTAGLATCAKACKKLGIAFIPGIELTAEPFADHSTMHILGYFIDPAQPDLIDLLDTQAEHRRNRIPKLVERLNELGVDITVDQVTELADGAVVGRPHVALVLKQKGYVKTIKDAFDRYLGPNGPAFVPKKRIDPSRAIEVIHAAGGLAVLAHPVQLNYADDAELTQTLGQLKTMGLDGLEVYHSDHTQAQVEQYTKLATRLDLCITGGSDYHGDRKDIILGSCQVPMAVYEALAGSARPNHNIKK